MPNIYIERRFSPIEHFITDIFGINCDDVIFLGYEINDTSKIFYLEIKPKPHFCPNCGNRLLSKGIYERTIRHPIFQDGKVLIIKLKQRTWRCRLCRKSINDTISFVQPRKRVSSMTPFLAISNLSNLDTSVKEIARRFHLSDTYVHNAFSQLISRGRLPLPEVLSIDEVFTNIDDDHKYSLVMMDFINRAIVDILSSRREEVIQPYFSSLPSEERANVKYLITDMYAPYLKYIKRFFPKALHIVDEFHVISSLEVAVHNYIKAVARKYETDSDERYILKKCAWVLLKKEDNISYTQEYKYNKRLHRMMNTESYEREFLKLDNNFEKIRELKELLHGFYDQPHDCVENDLNELIKTYKECDIKLFNDFSHLLYKFKKSIINSFITFEVKIGKYKESKLVRLSNGPMEGFNRKVKTLKRNNRGIKNFNKARTRILYSENHDTPFENVNMISPKIKQPGKRGKYKKH